MSKLLPLAVYSATVISIVCLVSQFHPNIQMAQSDQHSRLWKSTSMEEAALKKLDLSWIQYGKEKSDWALLVNSWLCVQGKPDSGGRVKPRGEKELIIYSEQDFNLTKVPGNFRVSIKKASPPPESKLESNRTAYFIKIRGLNTSLVFPNLHHFLNDFATVFFAIQKTVHHLPIQSIFFQLPILKEDHYLLPFFEALGIKHEHQYHLHDYNNVPDGTCFKQAVFADAVHPPLVEKSHRRHHDYPTKMKPVLQQIKSKFNLSQNECQSEQKPKITIIDRKDDRWIENIDNIMSALLNRGYKYISKVILEDLSMEEQMSLIQCTDVLVGVQGNGLQWASFLQDGASLIEIAWPRIGWHFFYADPEFASEFYPTVRFFQVEVPVSQVLYPKYVKVKGLLDFGVAMKGRPVVPIDLLLSAITKATSGQPSDAPWERFTVGDFDNRFNRFIRQDINTDITMEDPFVMDEHQTNILSQN